MNKTQKLKATVEDISFITTFENLPQQFKCLVDELEANPNQPAHTVNVTSGNASLFIQLEFVGKRPKAKVSTIFGVNTEEFMARQYN